MPNYVRFVIQIYRPYFEQFGAQGNWQAWFVWHHLSIIRGN